MTHLHGRSFPHEEARRVRLLLYYTEVEGGLAVAVHQVKINVAQFHEELDGGIVAVDACNVNGCTTSVVGLVEIGALIC